MKKNINETSIGQLKSVVQIFEQANVYKTVKKWQVKENLTDQECIEKICNTLEDEMKDQLDWFTNLDRIILSWYSGNRSDPEYIKYQSEKYNPIPLLRISDIRAVIRILEEFQTHDFKEMFYYMFEETQ
tara:strand:+ start:1470 stop:1856 length:387 start_codon:yes stop_codon:yes gene_type:complete